MTRRIHALLLAATLLGAVSAATAAEVYPTAVLPFQERGTAVRNLGGQITDLLTAQLAANPDLILVDRADLEQTLREHELNLSGMVSPGQATQVGQLTGARLLVTGSVMDADGKLYIIAKIIGTETTRVLAATAKGKLGDDLDVLVTSLATDIGTQMRSRGQELVAKPVLHEDLVAQLAKTLGDGQRQKVFIEVREHHVGQATIDPAAATELALFCRETGFTVIDEREGRRQDAEVILTGEGFSEFALRRGNLVSVKARLEVKAVDPQTGQVIASERQTAVVVDLTEQIAGKAALQHAAEQIALRLLPKLVRK